MAEPFLLFLTFIVGIIAGFIGATVGGGGLLSLPFLILLGLPPQVAIATNRLGAVGHSTGAIYKYWKEKKIEWQYVLPFSVLAVVGAYIGANALVQIRQDTLSMVIGILLLLLLPTLYVKKDLGVAVRETKTWKKTVGYITYFLLMIVGGFFGSGLFPLIFFALITLFGFTFIRASATNFIPWFAMSLVALGVFIAHGLVNYSLGTALLLGMLIGGYVGAHTAVKKGNAWVKSLFLVVVILTVFKLLFF